MSALLIRIMQAFFLNFKTSGFAFKKRKDSLRVAVKNLNVDFVNIEIINSKEEINTVKLIYEGNHLYLGIVQNE